MVGSVTTLDKEQHARIGVRGSFYPARIAVHLPGVTTKILVFGAAAALRESTALKSGHRVGGKSYDAF
jgi:hypothetical protein